MSPSCCIQTRLYSVLDCGICQAIIILLTRIGAYSGIISTNLAVYYNEYAIIMFAVIVQLGVNRRFKQKYTLTHIQRYSILYSIEKCVF